MMTAFGSVETAVEAMRAGAENYLVKPLDVNAVLVVLEKALEKRRLVSATPRSSASGCASGTASTTSSATSAELQAVFEVVKRAAPTRATVLILGESGTGKELIAQALHEESPRSDKPFVKVNCAALSETLLESELFGHEKGSFTGAIGRSEGRFELADGGTLFLDEIGEISPALQVKLLRVLQRARVRAGRRHPDAQGRRADRRRDEPRPRRRGEGRALPRGPLLPAQRRGGDAAAAAHAQGRHPRAGEPLRREVRERPTARTIKGLAPGTLNALLAHDWPGNVRELENVVERAVVLAQGPELTADDLPPDAARAPPARARAGSASSPAATLYEIEREAILRTLEMVGGSTSRAAEMLGISVRKIQYRLKEYAGGGPGADDGAEELTGS